MSIVPSVIGEGTYGCVHKPNLKCKNNNATNVKHHLSKIMLKKEAKNELHEYNSISKIDKNKDYFLGKPKYCVPKNNKTNRKAIKKCNLYYNSELAANTFSEGNLNEFALLIMKDGGKELSEYSKKVILNMPENKSTRVFIQKLWIEILRLFKGIQLFHRNGIAHHDLKPQNIVYDETKNRMNFIDFGFMRTYKYIMDRCVSNRYYIADYPFWCYPFEFPYMNKSDFMKIAKMSQKEKNDYYNQWITDLKTDTHSKISISMRLFFNYITRNSSELEKNLTMDKYFEGFKHLLMNEMVPKNYTNFIHKSIETIDVFGLGMSLQFVLNYCKPHMNETIYRSLEECFYHMMHPSLVSRFTIENAIAKFETILANMDIEHRNIKNLIVKHFTKKESKKYNSLIMDDNTSEHMLQITEELQHKFTCSRNKTRKNRK